MRRITSKPWFGPKKYSGWGWRVTSWQGAVVTAACMLAVVVSILLFRAWALPIIVVVVLLQIGIATVTGDPPGGPRHSGDDSARS